MFTDAIGQTLFEHSPVTCLGQPCTIHNPSDHHMASWPQVYRHDLKIMQRRCPHGIDHVDPDEFRTDLVAGYVHGCDGCCLPPAA